MMRSYYIQYAVRNCYMIFNDTFDLILNNVTIAEFETVSKGLIDIKRACKRARGYRKYIELGGRMAFEGANVYMYDADIYNIVERRALLEKLNHVTENI